VLQPDVVWVECHGETPPDRENVGPMVYFPLPGFRGVYFPFTGIEGYLSPLVAVHFKKPTRNDNRLFVFSGHDTYYNRLVYFITL
jgi:hypothetical protein